jgi:hypothetical protein
MHQLWDKVSLNIFEKSFGAYLNLIEIHLKSLILTSGTFDQAIERMNLRSPSHYGISVSQMTTYMFRLLYLQTSPYYRLFIGFLIRITRRVPLVGIAS